MILIGTVKVEVVGEIRGRLILGVVNLRTIVVGMFGVVSIDKGAGFI
jgi:hypothetical protein